MNENLFFNFLELFFVNEKINFIFKRTRKSETDSEGRKTKEMGKNSNFGVKKFIMKNIIGNFKPQLSLTDLLTCR